MSLQHVDQSIAVGGGMRASGAGANLARKAWQTTLNILPRYAVVLSVLAIWQLSGQFGWINAAVFPPPDVVLTALWDGIAGGVLLDDLAISLQRSGTAYASAVLFAVPLGIIMGQIPAIERALDPIVQIFRQTSALAVYPIFILILGLGEASKVFVIFWATLFPLLLNTIGGVKEVDHKLIEMARVYGASRLTVFRRVVMPGAIPSIFVGLRLSATTALLLLIASEMIGANQGVGFRVMNAQYNFQIPTMFASIVLLAAIGLSANYTLVFLQKRLCRWSDLPK
jgi:sulfonate transport system permease protein